MYVRRRLIFGVIISKQVENILLHFLNQSIPICQCKEIEIIFYLLLLFVRVCEYLREDPDLFPHFNLTEMTPN